MKKVYYNTSPYLTDNIIKRQIAFELLEKGNNIQCEEGKNDDEKKKLIKDTTMTSMNQDNIQRISKGKRWVYVKKFNCSKNELIGGIDLVDSF